MIIIYLLSSPWTSLPLSCFITAFTSNEIIYVRTCCDLLSRVEGEIGVGGGGRFILLIWLVVQQAILVFFVLFLFYVSVCVCFALSDHRTVFCKLSLRRSIRAKQQVTSQNLRRIDPISFQTDASSCVD